ncbi:hypothetical protein [Caballeronia sp. dw_19]|uniref:hypothetical protein n=1 Tax=Caballeronia sp. dw_19 TaxID=2719791 RepID=UPI0021055E7C|nr:hypothetical protein [Caballeronia sp. dw_19]
MFVFPRFAMIGAVVVATSLAVPVTSVFAQEPASSGSTAKKKAKTQRKVARKAARAKTNAELETLKKKGYKPEGKQTNYPQDLQDAESKANAAKPGPAEK